MKKVIIKKTTIIKRGRPKRKKLYREPKNPNFKNRDYADGFTDGVLYMTAELIKTMADDLESVDQTKPKRKKVKKRKK